MDGLETLSGNAQYRLSEALECCRSWAVGINFWVLPSAMGLGFRFLSGGLRGNREA